MVTGLERLSYPLGPRNSVPLAAMNIAFFGPPLVLQ